MLLRSFALFGGLTLFCTLAMAASPFEGQWANKTVDASDVSQVEISGSGAQLSVKVSGSCKTEDCSWPPTLGTVYSDDVHIDPSIGAKLLVAMLPTNQGDKILFMRTTGPYQAQVQVLTRYRGSTENNYVKTYAFSRTDIPKDPPPAVTATPTAAAAAVAANSALATNTVALSIPELLSPGDNKTLYNYPRKTTLTWKAVPGASSYGLEVDCFNCCQFNKWCSTQGNPWLLEKSLSATTYTFDFIGPQAARWRVWAIGADGHTGDKSTWRNFKYGR